MTESKFLSNFNIQCVWMILWLESRDMACESTSQRSTRKLLRVKLQFSSKTLSTLLFQKWKVWDYFCFCFEGKYLYIRWQLLEATASHNGATQLPNYCLVPQRITENKEEKMTIKLQVQNARAKFPINRKLQGLQKKSHWTKANKSQLLEEDREIQN